MRFTVSIFLTGVYLNLAQAKPAAPPEPQSPTLETPEKTADAALGLARVFHEDLTADYIHVEIGGDAARWIFLHNDVAPEYDDNENIVIKAVPGGFFCKQILDSKRPTYTCIMIVRKISEENPAK
jgi:hypothetical protein